MVRRIRHSQGSLVAMLAISPAENRGGMTKPLRMSRSRLPIIWVSMVTISAS